MREAFDGIPTLVAYAIKVNSNQAVLKVIAGGHAKISTGKKENKFGIPFGRAREVYARIAALPGVSAVGIDMHIGSQIEEMTPFDNAYALMAELVRDLRAQGHTIHHVDVGGG